MFSFKIAVQHLARRDAQLTGRGQVPPTRRLGVWEILRICVTGVLALSLVVGLGLAALFLGFIFAVPLVVAVLVWLVRLRWRRRHRFHSVLP